MATTADDVVNHHLMTGDGGDDETSGRNHVILFPFMAKGHTLPLLHFATVLSALHGENGVLRVTVVTTPANVAFVRGRLPAPVRLVVLPFPSLPPLPPGIESTDALPSPSLYPTFLRATALLRDPFAAFLASLLPSRRPLVLVSDFFLGFTHRVAADAGVRRVVFHGMSCFALAISKSLVATPLPPSSSASSFHVARMPEHVRITAGDVSDVIRKINTADPDDPVARFIIGHVTEPDVRSWGVLVNSFAALERDYVAPLESFYLQPTARAWLVGPLFFTAGEESEEQDDDTESCIQWLDERPAESVVYVSFGTQAHVTDEQLDELAHGLVLSGHPFLWAVRSSTWRSSMVELAAAVDGRIVRGWVPQRSVLAHRAVGGFLSHCGWNSVMESLAAGKPVLAWPMGAEQRLNAKHVTEIIGAGVRMDGGGDQLAPVVGRSEVEEKVRRLMDAGGEEGRRMRARAREAQQAAKTAVAEGGTSHAAMLELVAALHKSYGDDGVVVEKKQEDVKIE